MIEGGVLCKIVAALVVGVLAWVWEALSPTCFLHGGVQRAFAASTPLAGATLPCGVVDGGAGVVCSQSELLRRMPTCFRATRVHSVGANTITPARLARLRPWHLIQRDSRGFSPEMDPYEMPVRIPSKSNVNEKLIVQIKIVRHRCLYTDICLRAPWRTRWRRSCGANSSKSEVPERHLKRSCAHSAAGQGAKSKVPFFGAII
jgi:hypothetical protein